MGRYSIKRYKTKRRTRDLDLIYNDLSSKESIIKLKNQPLDENLAGLGQYYCIQCAHYYENQLALDRHNKGKKHKRRVRELLVKPYTNLEAEAASGVNMVKFMESVENYKAMEAHKKENKEEYDELVGQRNGNLDDIITGSITGEAVEGAGPVEGEEVTNATDAAEAMTD